ncbi:large ribosomal subunit protein bL21c [Aristolochia californica]|uniref:large ribosomal subunit protein bL21c n=1 Tax=Aristolochia californica TaxID=171875 RepID=UPI0035DF48C9
MASMTLSFSTTPSTILSPASKARQIPASVFFRNNLNSISLASSIPSCAPSLALYQNWRIPVSAASEISETEEALVVEADEVSVVDSEADSDSERTTKTDKKRNRIEIPKGDEVFAVVVVGSRQYIVFPGRFINTQRLKGANVNDKIILNKVLLVGSKSKTYIGKPVVTNAAVHAVVEEQALDKKVIVFKYKKKKNYRRNIGHRQPITRIRITGITGYEDSPAVTLAATA